MDIIFFCPEETMPARLEFELSCFLHFFLKRKCCYMELDYYMFDDFWITFDANTIKIIDQEENEVYVSVEFSFANEFSDHTLRETFTFKLIRTDEFHVKLPESEVVKLKKFIEDLNKTIHNNSVEEVL